MGMFDEITVRPLGDTLYQTKDTPSQFLDQYEIRADGSLVVEEYDIEDRSDKNAKGLAAFAGCMTRVNKRWKPCGDFTGAITFYDGDDTRWVEYTAWVVKGQCREIRNEKGEVVWASKAVQP